MSIYDIVVKDNKDNYVSLNEYKGKVLLIVNTATRCGLSNQFNDLEETYSKYRDKGFEILAFPCNQFLNQEPLTDFEISDTCKLIFNTSFKIFKKIDVNGINEDSLFTFLKKEAKGLLGNDIKWNFTKFLISRNGKVIKRFPPITSPKKIQKYIDELI
ncbi:glutathione peroxidase [Streptobacillus felis]|uniref:Glutathione peroxidase n=1 Tax=Streptobacillus felis TaxID=1384509 RepID=A0A7Z0TAL1_9FUSO|nr:glutathione peroxidase [Streptobacillus felis]NYV28132.1 glutathione peroxidase [Streptobacillus felis]